MASPSLSNYEFQFKDSGTLLGGPDDTLPFWDIDETEGFTGLSFGDATVYDKDGQHGSTTYLTYLAHRNLLIRGTLFASTSGVDSEWADLAATMIPDGLDYPLHFQLPGMTQMYYEAKPVVARLAMDRGRRLGTAPYLLQWMASDPRAYNDVTQLGLTSGVNTSTLTNSGNTESMPVWTCSAAASTSVTVRCESVTQSRWVQFAFTTPSGSTASIEVNTMKRQLLVDGTVFPATFTQSGGWPTFQSGSNVMKITLTNASSGQLDYRSAWML